MHWLDLVIVAIIAWLTFRALSVGLIREVVTAIAVVGGALLAGHFYTELADDIAFAIEDQTWRELAAFGSIFIGVVVAGQILAALLQRAAALLLLGPVDRVGGAAFGFLKGVLVVEILLFASLTFPVSSDLDRAIDDSTLAPVFVDGFPVLLQILPDEFEAAADGLPRDAAPVEAVAGR
jgi:membrane protein required for colicin V production